MSKHLNRRSLLLNSQRLSCPQLFNQANVTTSFLKCTTTSYLNWLLKSNLIRLYIRLNMGVQRVQFKTKEYSVQSSTYVHKNQHQSIIICTRIQRHQQAQLQEGVQTIHGVKKIINLVLQNKMHASSSIHAQLVVMVGNHSKLMTQGVRNTTSAQTIINKVGI